MPGINDLVQAVGQSAKSNKYRVIVNTGTEELDILVTNTTMPGKQSTPVDIWYRGRKYQARGETNFNATWTIEFYNRVDLDYRATFLQWMNNIHESHVESTGALEALVPSSILQGVNNTVDNVKNLIEDVSSIIEDPAGNLLDPILGQSSPSYQKSAKVFQLDNDANVVYFQEFVGLFPIDVSDIDYSDENPDISKTTVTFAFSDILFNGEGKPTTAEGLFGTKITDVFR